jgi:hypothetical protein
MRQGCRTTAGPSQRVLPGKQKDRPPRRASEDDSEELRRMVQVIVHDFNGNTSAYFNSVKPVRVRGLDADATESKIALSFAKSM